MNFYFQFRIVFDIIISILMVVLGSWNYTVHGMEWHFIQINQAEDISALAGIVLGASVSLMGFVLAAGTFLVTHIGSGTLPFLQQDKPYQQLIDVIMSCLWRLLALSTTAGFGLALNHGLLDWISYLIAFLASMATISTAVMIWAFGNIARLTNMARPKSST